jgi:prepilin-type N-terminal cleavage/methylation domain-containing protein
MMKARIITVGFRLGAFPAGIVRARAAFTLTELLVTLAIIAILSAMMLGGLASAGRSQKRDATKLFIQRISSALMEAYEDAEDDALSLTSLAAVRQYLRSMFPDSWDEVAASSILPTPTTAMERVYWRYKMSSGAPSAAYQGAECLYMIVTQSGRFSDLLSQIRSDQVGDVDEDGKKEFLDAWGNPIAFLRWAPGYVSPAISLLTTQIADPVTYHDPFDRWYVEGSPPTGPDVSAYALFPLIYSAGPDEAGNAGTGGGSGYGLIRASNGWPNGALIPMCGFNPSGTGLVGAPDPSNSAAYLDNVTNFELMLE